jgi:hypothetical protein
MILNDSIDLVNKEKRKQERVKAVQRFAAGAGIVVAASAVIRILFTVKKRKETQDMEKRCLRKNGKCKKEDK